MAKTYIDDNIKYNIEIEYLDKDEELQKIVLPYDDIAKTSPSDFKDMLIEYIEKTGAKKILNSYILTGTKKINISIPNTDKETPYFNHELTQTSIFPKAKKDYGNLFNLQSENESSNDNILSFEEKIERYFEKTSWEDFTDTEKIHARCFLEKYCKEKEEIKKLILDKRNKQYLK